MLKDIVKAPRRGCSHRKPSEQSERFPGEYPWQAPFYYVFIREYPDGCIFYNFGNIPIFRAWWPQHSVMILRAANMEVREGSCEGATSTTSKAIIFNL